MRQSARTAGREGRESTRGSSFAEAKARIEGLEAELAAARAREAATAEVLEVINASPGDLTPVFDAMLERAMRLCEATHGQVWRFDGEQLHAVAARGDPEFIEWLQDHSPIRPVPGSAADRIARGERLVHLTDRREEDAYRDDPVFRGMVDTSGVRASVSVALRKDETLLGMINVYRPEVRPFTDKQIALLQNFAAQAVVAMENARLLGDTREALEQQTATVEVLRAISSSPADAQPTFDAIAAAAMKLCDAANAVVFRFDGSLIHFAAQHGLTTAQLDALRNTFPLAPGRNSVTARAIMTRQVVHLPDLAADPELHPSLIEAGLRGSASVPMLRDSEPIGAITITRHESRSFTDKQISLLRVFADQAVIAIENARLIAETREALEQQTATAEVLQVINSSPGDLTPVFDAILEKACLLCEAEIGTLWTYDDEHMRASAIRGAPPAYADFLHRGSPHPISGEHKRLLGGESFIHTADVTDTETYRSGHPVYRAAADLGGVRTFLGVPLRKDEHVLGHFGIYRQEVRPFSEKQIALVQNFSAQAVIAMENARLITETREALEQQTATAEVLGVINSSPGDLAPVFDAMLDKAMRLCGAAFGELRTYDGERFNLAAVHGLPSAYVDYYRTHNTGTYGPGTGPALLLAGKRLVHVPNLIATEPYREGDPDRRALVDLGGARAHLLVPLRQGRAVLGYIMIYRQESGPFPYKQIALLENFAVQAVFAMENARLITETREALAQQTATAEVLQVINSSPGNLAPVFEAMLDKATHLCEASYGMLYRYDGDRFRAVALHAVPTAYADFLREPFRADSRNALGAPGRRRTARPYA